MKWTNTIEAVKRGERHQWAIGDAIIADCADSTEGNKTPLFKDCVKKLKDLGYNYNAKTLGDLYLTATRFKKAERRLDVAWASHRVAANAENLDRAIKELRKLGKSPMEINVRWIMGVWRDKAKAKRDKAAADAEAKVRQAKSRKKQAAEDKLAAKNPAAREKAAKELEEAKRLELEAIAQRDTLPPEPAFDANVDPDAMPDVFELELSMFAAAMEVDAEWMIRRMRKSMEKIESYVDRLPQSTVNKLVRAHRGVAQQANKVIEAVGGILREVPKGGAA